MKLQLVVLENSRRKYIFPLGSRETIVGRGEGCAVRIPSSEVSRRHCRIVQAGGRVTVTDLNSVNGTYLNEELVVGDAVIVAGDQLRVGPVTFFLGGHVLPGPPGGRAPPMPRPSQEFEPGQITEDPTSGARCSLAEAAAEPEPEPEPPVPGPLRVAEHGRRWGSRATRCWSWTCPGRPRTSRRKKTDRNDR